MRPLHELNSAFSYRDCGPSSSVCMLARPSLGDLTAAAAYKDGAACATLLLRGDLRRAAGCGP
jgi:hypothetical protein